MHKLVMIMLISLLLVPTAWARGAYKWIDDNGVVHYSDRLRGDQASVINIPVREPEDSATGTEPPAADDNSNAADSGDKTTARAAVVDPKTRKENCAKARKQLQTNQRLSRMYRIVNGERHYLSAKERDDIIKRSRDAVDYWCQ